MLILPAILDLRLIAQPIGCTLIRNLLVARHTSLLPVQPLSPILDASFSLSCILTPMPDYRAWSLMSLKDEWTALRELDRAGHHPDSIRAVRKELIRRLGSGIEYSYTDVHKSTTSSADFSILLANFRALSLYYQQIHWLSTGSDFYEDHLLAERLYNEAGDAIDAIAEKGIAVTGNGNFVLLPDQLAKVSAIISRYPNTDNIDSMFRAAEEFEKKLGSTIDEMFKADTSAAMSDFLGALADGGLQRLYLVQGRNK